MTSKPSSINGIVIAVALAAATWGVAQAADRSTRARDFAIQNQYLQEQSTNMPHESLKVDRSVAPADPVPKASAYGGERERFQALDQQLQAESTNMPAGSPPVDRSSVNADPAPRGVAEERFLQRKSTK